MLLKPHFEIQMHRDSALSMIISNLEKATLEFLIAVS